MNFLLLSVYLLNRFIVLEGIRFSAESFSEIAILAKEGKQHLESINEKANVPQYGPCWKNAISDLQIGCKFLSENVQSDLALRFTDCFLQMSGHEPIICNGARDSCLQRLSDRAFNAYTEFYTHTQSICYFLQSQIWHEEAEKTINKLSHTSSQVSAQLEEAEKTQEKLLLHQQESLVLQHDLINNGKNIANTLELSKDTISRIMEEFQISTLEQKKALFDLFDKLSSLRSWAVGEVSWLNSIVFYTSAIILSYLFTSASRTQQARIFIFLLLTCNYFIERYVYTSIMDNSKSNMVDLTDDLNWWIWVCRKIFICLSILVTLITAIHYCDYDLVNYQLLVEIKNQNSKILSYFKSQCNGFKSDVINSTKSPVVSNKFMISRNQVGECQFDGVIPLPYESLNLERSRSFQNGRVNVRESPSVSVHRDTVDNLSVISEKSNVSSVMNETKSPYNLRRSSRIKKKAESEV